MTIPHFPFYFIRHGETDWNVSNRIMGHKDIPLNENGIKQAHELLPIIKDYEFEKIWSSPLLRTSQTAQIIADSFGVEIEYNDLLKERGWGTGEGEAHEYFLPDMTPMDKTTRSSENTLPIGAETYNEFEARIIRVFKEILMPNRQASLVVSHGGVFHVLTTLLANEMNSAKNCDIYLFQPPQTSPQPWNAINLTESK